MGQLARQVIALDDVLGGGARLVERLQEMPTPKLRFALLDAVLLTRLRDAAPVAPELEHAWALLRASDARSRSRHLPTRWAGGGAIS
jgi:hypothetical protein